MVLSAYKLTIDVFIATEIYHHIVTVICKNVVFVLLFTSAALRFKSPTSAMPAQTPAYLHHLSSKSYKDALHFVQMQNLIKYVYIFSNINLSEYISVATMVSIKGFTDLDAST